MRTRFYNTDRNARLGLGSRRFCRRPRTTDLRAVINAIMLATCLAGAGIARVMALGVQSLLESGQLVELFPDWPGETFPLYAIHPPRSNPAAKFRAFFEFCLAISRIAAQTT